MMAEKARLFHDQSMLAEILAADGPKEAKAFGRKVRGFDNDAWNEHRTEIVKRGNLAKFSQHVDLKEFLLQTRTYQTQQPLGLVAEPKTKYETKSNQAKQSSSDARKEVRERVREQPKRYDVVGATESVVDQKEYLKNIKSKIDAKGLLTSNVILVEAAGRDTIWGIGLGKQNPKSSDPFTWRGLNLLGFVLTAVRDEIFESSQPT